LGVAEPLRAEPPDLDGPPPYDFAMDEPSPAMDPAFVPEALSDVRAIRVFGTPAFRRLWFAQLVSSLGDWIGFFAITAIAARLGGSSSGVAVGVVLSARLIPGFFLGPVVGVVVDRWDRRRMMVACDVGRGAVLASLPFIHSIAGLFVASLLLELMTLSWSAAKEASVPNLVSPEFLASANSLSLISAYGTFPIGSAVFALLAKVAEWMGRYPSLHTLRFQKQEALAIYFDVATFIVSAIVVSTLALHHERRSVDGVEQHGLVGTMGDLREGWRFITSTPVVRAVILGLGTGLFGGGMLVPLGPSFSTDVLGGGSAGFGLLLTALGVGVAVGILGISFIQKRLSHERVFVWSLFVAGFAIILGASSSTLTPALLAVGVLGLCAGSVYVLGFTLLQANVADSLRGRTFATLYTLIRLCLLLAFVMAPILSTLLDRISKRAVHRVVHAGGLSIALPGTRLTLWLGALIILGAGLTTYRTLQSAEPTESTQA
jgi:dTMP kinase